MKWIGGKKALRQKILDQFPTTKIERYIEVFGGAGWILFSKDKHANFEVFNDINHHLINLFRCVKYHPEAVQKELEYHLNSREQFFDYNVLIDFRGFTDIQKAAMYFILVCESFGAGKTSFSTRPQNMLKKIDSLSDVKERLKSVLIENKDFEDLIKVYDRENALFYCDPPYFGTEKYYSDDFSIADHERLKNTLTQVKGKFVLSYNDHEWIRDLYSDFKIQEIERRNTLAGSSNTNIFKELLITNY